MLGKVGRVIAVRLVRHRRPPTTGLLQRLCLVRRPAYPKTVNVRQRTSRPDILVQQRAEMFGEFHDSSLLFRSERARGNSAYQTMERLDLCDQIRRRRLITHELVSHFQKPG
jgi:hypothetical protein